ncbi:MAG: S-layer homology domain-containing protein [Clostridiales Family XIII bacterium]|nr:S-layer homology domain-containing protein [Clostridiales Family XIII bacterium]
MKSLKITAFVLTFILITATGTPAFAGWSEKFPETATAGEHFSLATTYQHSYAIKDGVLWTWGNEGNGVDEKGYVVYKKRPAPEPIMTSAASVRIGNSIDATFVLKTDGSLWSWGFQGTGGILGDNREGNISYLNSQGYTFFERFEPAQIMDGVSAVCAEIDCDFAFAIKTDASLWGWGANKSYQLGDGTQEERFIPVKIMDGVRSVRIANDENEPSDMLVHAIKTDGSLWKWGTDYDETGQLQAEFKIPTQVTENVDEIIAGFKNPWLDDGGTYHFARYGGDETIGDVAEITDSGYGDYLIKKTDGSIWYKGRNGGNFNHSGYGEILLKEDPTATYYLISFDPNGGQNGSYAKDTTDRNGKLIALPSAYKTDSDALEGWFTDPEGGTLVTTDTVFTSDSTVYAHWVPNVPVTNISGVPAETVAGTELILGDVAVVEPANATSKNIIWSVYNQGNTGATIRNGVFSAPEAGTAKILAVILNGVKYGSQYTKGFTITVKSSSSDPTETPSGGSGGGGGSGSVPAAQTVTSAGGSVSVSHTLSGGNATLSLPDGKVDEVIAKSEGAAVFDLSKLSGATAATLPKAALTKLAEADLALDVKLPQGAVTLSKEAAASAGAQANGAVTLSLKAANSSALNSEQKAVAGDRPLYDVSVRDAGGAYITSFDGGLITVSIPYEIKAGEEANGLVVYRLDERGNMQKMETHYDAAAKSVVFTTDHLSLYLLAYDENETDRPQGNLFADVKTSDWFFGDVEYVHANGLMTGTSATAFSPQAKLTRAMLVTILHRLAASPAAGENAAFDDVDGASWYGAAVNWAAEKDVVAGVGDGKFAPNDDVTREQIAVILYRYAQYAGTEPQGNWAVRLDFADVRNISDWATEGAMYCYKDGIIAGKPGNLFDPQGEATRAEAAAMLHRFVESVK